MALKFIIPFPLFSPPNPNPSDDRPATEVRFSRWNNANAQKFILRERAQKEIEDEIRLNKRFDSALRIAEAPSADDPSSSGAVPPFKSIGTPSSPSRPSIPGRASKYSKPPKPQKPHPAFRPVVRVRKIPAPADEAPSTDKGLKIGENGVSYVIPGAPFEFQYSYTETPKVKPVKLREPPYAPFGPSTMPRPWTGRAPLPPSKKKLKEFDSFRLPPPYKKGVKPVQAPGPFLPGSGPKYVMSREEILGEPLTKEEVKDLIVACIKTKRQLNIGRDGLTHNMLDNIHALWKRRRVCKIKCKGVCTVDMDNVRQQLEEKTGGKIIHSRGGVIFLFRGRNYNYRTRPRFPLMLWKPVTPVYPRLVQRAPEGLSLEEASEMRKKGRQLTPICKLAKNGVYCKLVKNAREAFEECELVRINCQGLNSSDYHKIGAKLKDLVPCVLLSFENEHILMWRGRDWKSSFPTSEDGDKEEEDSEIDAAIAAVPVSEDQELSVSHDPDLSLDDKSLDTEVESIPLMDSETLDVQKTGDTHIFTAMTSPSIEETKLDEAVSDNESAATAKNSKSNTTIGSTGYDNTDNISVGSDTMLEMNGSNDTSEATEDGSKAVKSSAAMEGVVTLWKQALETGSAVVLDTASLDADVVYERAVVFAQSAPPGPVFMRQPRKIAVKKPEKLEKEDTDVLEVEESVVIREKKGSGRMGFKNKRKMDFKDGLLGAVPQGSLRVDELAKLLA